MLSTILAFVAGLGLAGLAFWISGGGVVGLVISMLVAVCGYVGVSYLTAPERRLGRAPASTVPNGFKAVEAIDKANACLSELSKLTARARDPQVRKEANDIVVATTSLVRYVEANPSSYDVLRHFINTYGEQSVKLLGGYVEVEDSGASNQVFRAKTETIEALQALETTAAGELSRAVEAKTLALSANSDAIVRLANMDGYSVDDDTPGGDRHTSQSMLNDAGRQGGRNPQDTRNTQEDDQA